MKRDCAAHCHRRVIVFCVDHCLSCTYAVKAYRKLMSFTTVTSWISLCGRCDSSQGLLSVVTVLFMFLVLFDRCHRRIEHWDVAPMTWQAGETHLRRQLSTLQQLIHAIPVPLHLPAALHTLPTLHLLHLTTYSQSLSIPPVSQREERPEGGLTQVLLWISIPHLCLPGFPCLLFQCNGSPSSCPRPWTPCPSLSPSQRLFLSDHVLFILHWLCPASTETYLSLSHFKQHRPSVSPCLSLPLHSLLLPGPAFWKNCL